MATTSAERGMSAFGAQSSAIMERGRDGAPYIDALPIIEHTAIEGAMAVMALDLAGVARVITSRKFNRYTTKYIDGVPVEEGMYEFGFRDFSELRYAHPERHDDGSEQWKVGEKVIIKGIDEQAAALANRLSRLKATDNLLVPAYSETYLPDTWPQIDVNNDGTMHVTVPSIDADGDASVTSPNYQTVNVSIDGVMSVLESAKLDDGVCLGPEDPTVISLDDGTVCMFITLAIATENNGWHFETLMAKGPSINQLEAVGFVPLGTIKELCFGPAYPTADGDKRVVLGEGSTTGYSTIRAATVDANLELDSFKDDGLVSLFPPNVRDRFADFYAGTTDTPEAERYRWLGEHASPNKAMLPLFDGWHLVMTSGRSREEWHPSQDYPPMGPFEVGLIAVQLDPSHKYAGQCIWADDRPLFHLRSAESITFGSDWYIKPDDTIGLDQTIVFIVHADDKAIYPVEIPVRTIWERLPDFLNDADIDKTNATAEIVIAPHIDLPIESRHTAGDSA